MTTPSADDHKLRALLGPILRPRRRALAFLSGTALAFGLCEALVLVLVARIAFAMSRNLDSIDASLGPINVSSSIGQVLAFTAVLVVVRFGLHVATGWQSARIVARSQAEARTAFAAAFLDATWERQHKEEGGRLQELLTTFVGQIASVVDSVAKGITSLLSLIALIVTAIAVSPGAAFGLVFASLVLGMTLRPLRSVIRKASRRVAGSNLAFAGAINELSGMGQEIQVFGVEREVNTALDDLIEDNAHVTMRQSFLSFLYTPIYTTFMLLVLVIALAVIWKTQMSDLEELSAIMLVMLRSLAYGQVVQGVYAGLQMSVPFLVDLDGQLAAYRDDAVDRSGEQGVGGGGLGASEVGYSYDGTRAALEGVSFAVEPGEVVGIIGPSGSGKSTLVQLLLRLRYPTSGSIAIGETPIDRVALDEWRRMVSFVPQEASLIRGTVSENLRFYRPEVTQEMIEGAAKAAHIHDEIVALADGYDTVLGGGDVHLSGGQRQRLCIARALLMHPSVLILDEPTSALDMRSEDGIRRTLRQLRGEVTILIVAHRLSTLDICDRIMVIQDGHLVAFGTPEHLAGTSDFYLESLALSGLAP